MKNRFAMAALTVWGLSVSAAFAHTNSVGFIISPSAVTSCLGGGGTECYDVEVFYGSWHSGTLTPEGELALFYQEPGGGETQVIGPSVGPSTAFSMSHSQLATVPNGLTDSSDNYSTVGTANYNALISVFTPGSDYFYSGGDGGTLVAVPTASTSGVYSHQSSIGAGLGPGTYRIAYDAINTPVTATWDPQPGVQGALFTITAGGGVVVDTGGAPTAALSAPSGPHSGAVTVTVTFSEDVSGLELADFTVVGATLSNLVPNSDSEYTLTMTPTAAGTTAGEMTLTLPEDSADDTDSNGNLVSNTLEITLSAAAGPSETDLEAVVETVQNLEDTYLRTQLQFDRRLVRGARDRFQSRISCNRRQFDEDDPNFDLNCDEFVTRFVPFDIDGSFTASVSQAALVGDFFGLSTSGDVQRLVFGEFEFTIDDEGTVTSVFDGRVAWERMVTDDTMFGYFVGAQLGITSVSGDFDGTQRRAGVVAGIYGLHSFDDVIVDGFLSTGIAVNDLSLSDGVTDYDGEYWATYLVGGASVSGTQAFDGFDLEPELALDFGYSNIGDISLDVTSASFDTVSTIDADYVAYAAISLTPEFVIPGEFGPVYTSGEHRIAPSLICEMTYATNSDRACGAALELGLNAWTDDGLGQVSIRIRGAQIGGRESYGGAVSVTHQF